MKKLLSLLFGKNMIRAVLLGLVVAWLGVSVAVYLCERNVPTANITSLEDSLWWGIVTLFTVGYGEFHPVTFEGRIWAFFLMVAGITSTGILTAKVASIFLRQALMEDKGVVDTESLFDHFIICGWKDDMVDLLDHVSHFNPDLDIQQIVVVADLSDHQIDEIRIEKKFRKIQFARGAPYQAAVLEQAAPTKARRIFILADRTPSESGISPSAQEADARTIMTAHTISKLAPQTLVTAELLDRRLDEHLKMAGVSEILYSREHSRLLIGNATGGSGIPNVISDLLDPTSDAAITTCILVSKFVGKKYCEFKEIYEHENPGTQVIGVLENTGNPHSLKEMALREAQKTADVRSMVDNLKDVKSIRCNSPIFSPDKDYEIKKGSSAIVIENTLANQYLRKMAS